MDLGPLCHRAVVGLKFFSWIFRGSKFFSWIFRGSNTFFRGYFAGPKFFLVNILWVQNFMTFNKLQQKTEKNIWLRIVSHIINNCLYKTYG